VLIGLCRSHIDDFITAYKFGRRLKTLNGRSPYEYIVLVPGRGASSLSPSGSSSCISQCSSRCDTEIARSEMVFSSG
jgi:hypothetical protein